jgi:type I restriction enzyme M protein
VVVPNGTLFGDGVAGRIKQELLGSYNLHTVLRLPNGVFAPYTAIATNVLFFDRSGPTRDIWFYEHRLPDGRKTYTKTQPLQFEEFGPLFDWWDHREEDEQAWRIPVEAIVQRGFNLDVKNPRSPADLEHLPPTELVERILADEEEFVSAVQSVRGLLGELPGC